MSISTGYTLILLATLLSMAIPAYVAHRWGWPVVGWLVLAWAVGWAALLWATVFDLGDAIGVALFPLTFLWVIGAIVGIATRR